MLKITTKALTKAQEQQARAFRYYGAASDQYKAACEAVGAIVADLQQPVADALAAINGRASAHCVTRYREVLEFAMTAESMLDRADIPQKNRVGIDAFCRPEIKLPNAYKASTVLSTDIYIKRTADGWRFVKAEKVERFTKSAGKVVPQISEEVAEIVKSNAIGPFAVAA
ncbi:MAG: hypothetical protein KDA35_10365 [Hyphomonadaceae bacterium]|nr:hypothetical protein [Hyphomonadaceae bacterium]